MLSFLKGGEATIKVVPERTHYQPGEQVRVQVTVAAEKHLPIREGRVALCSKHELQHRVQEHRRDSSGRTRTVQTTTWRRFEQEVDKTVILPEGVLPGGTETVHECTFTIPPQASPTCAGRIIHVEWWVKVTLDRKMAKDVEERVDLLVFKALPGTSGSGRCGMASEPGEAEMAFELPSREWVLGDTIEGQLLVRPLKDIAVTEVRVELVGAERVWNTMAGPLDALGPLASGPGLSIGFHIGSDPNVNETEGIQKLKVAGGGTLKAGQELAYPFRLTIPSPGPVTCKLASGSVTWMVRGVLARRLRSDTKCEAEILVAGARG